MERQVHMKKPEDARLSDDGLWSGRRGGVAAARTSDPGRGGQSVGWAKSINWASVTTDDRFQIDLSWPLGQGALKV